MVISFIEPIRDAQIRNTRVAAAGALLGGLGHGLGMCGVLYYCPGSGVWRLLCCGRDTGFLNGVCGKHKNQDATKQDTNAQFLLQQHGSSRLVVFFFCLFSMLNRQKQNYSVLGGHLRLCDMMGPIIAFNHLCVFWANQTENKQTNSFKSILSLEVKIDRNGLWSWSFHVLTNFLELQWNKSAMKACSGSSGTQAFFKKNAT